MVMVGRATRPTGTHPWWQSFANRFRVGQSEAEAMGRLRQFYSVILAAIAWSAVALQMFLVTRSSWPPFAEGRHPDLLFVLTDTD
jgi:hypothetical protein